MCLSATVVVSYVCILSHLPAALGAIKNPSEFCGHIDKEGNCLRVLFDIASPLTAEQAENACKQKDGHLASAKTLQENIIIKERLKNIGLGHTAWLGGRSFSTPWKWETGLGDVTRSYTIKGGDTLWHNTDIALLGSDVILEVEACHDTHIALWKNTHYSGKPGYYEIILERSLSVDNNDGDTVISGTPRAETVLIEHTAFGGSVTRATFNSSGVLDCAKLRYFWVSWADTLLRVAIVTDFSQPGKDLLLSAPVSYSDDWPVRSLSFKQLSLSNSKISVITNGANFDQFVLPNGADYYHFLSAIDLRSTEYVLVEIKVCGGLYILFEESFKSAYEIALQTSNGNEISRIANGTKTLERRTLPVNLLNCYASTILWFTWHQGHIAAGHGKAPQAVTVIEWRDPRPLSPKRFGIKVNQPNGRVGTGFAATVVVYKGSRFTNNQGCRDTSSLQLTTPSALKFNNTSNLHDLCRHRCKISEYPYAVLQGNSCACTRSITGARTSDSCVNSNRDSGFVLYVNGAYSSWHSNEPRGEGQCGTIAAEEGFFWAASDCSSHLAFICELDSTTAQSNTINTGAESKVCFENQNCYLLFTEPLVTWQTAVEMCQSKTDGFGRLAKVANKLTEKVLQSLLQHSSFHGRVWIGASSVSWKWPSGHTFTYTDWHVGQPVTKDNGTQFCMVMLYDSRSKALKWSSESCNARHRFYICQYKVPPSSHLTTTSPQLTTENYQTTFDPLSENDTFPCNDTNDDVGIVNSTLQLRNECPLPGYKLHKYKTCGWSVYTNCHPLLCRDRELCADYCKKQLNCVGFSFNSGRCLLKNAYCDDLFTTDPNGSFYETEIPGFTRFRGKCGRQSLTVQVFDRMSIHSCASHCQNLNLCSGFDFSSKIAQCFLKASTCKQTIADSYITYFAKGKFPTTPLAVVITTAASSITSTLTTSPTTFTTTPLSTTSSTTPSTSTAHSSTSPATPSTSTIDSTPPMSTITTTQSSTPSTTSTTTTSTTTPSTSTTTSSTPTTTPSTSTTTSSTPTTTSSTPTTSPSTSTTTPSTSTTTWSTSIATLSTSTAALPTSTDKFFESTSTLKPTTLSTTMSTSRTTSTSSTTTQSPTPKPTTAILTTSASSIIFPTATESTTISLTTFSLSTAKPTPSTTTEVVSTSVLPSVTSVSIEPSTTEPVYSSGAVTTSVTSPSTRPTSTKSSPPLTTESTIPSTVPALSTVSEPSTATTHLVTTTPFITSPTSTSRIFKSTSLSETTSFTPFTPTAVLSTLSSSTMSTVERTTELPLSTAFTTSVSASSPSFLKTTVTPSSVSFTTETPSAETTSHETKTTEGIPSTTYRHTTQRATLPSESPTPPKSTPQESITGSSATAETTAAFVKPSPTPYKPGYREPQQQPIHQVTVIIAIVASILLVIIVTIILICVCILFCRRKQKMARSEAAANLPALNDLNVHEQTLNIPSERVGAIHYIPAPLPLAGQSTLARAKVLENQSPDGSFNTLTSFPGDVLYDPNSSLIDTGHANPGYDPVFDEGWKSFGTFGRRHQKQRPATIGSDNADHLITNGDPFRAPARKDSVVGNSSLYGGSHIYEELPDDRLVNANTPTSTLLIPVPSDLSSDTPTLPYYAHTPHSSVYNMSTTGPIAFENDTLSQFSSPYSNPFLSPSMISFDNSDVTPLFASRPSSQFSPSEGTRTSVNDSSNASNSTASSNLPNSFSTFGRNRHKNPKHSNAVEMQDFSPGARSTDMMIGNVREPPIGAESENAYLSPVHNAQGVMYNGSNLSPGSDSLADDSTGANAVKDVVL